MPVWDMNPKEKYRNRAPKVFLKSLNEAKWVVVSMLVAHSGPPFRQLLASGVKRAPLSPSPLNELAARPPGLPTLVENCELLLG